MTDAEAREELARLERLARLLDASIGIPGTRYTVGIDALIGLLPGVGDALTAVVGLWIVHRARLTGARRATLLRMLGNLALDFVAGTVPIAGDLFDAAYKANVRNVHLLAADLERGSKASSTLPGNPPNLA